MSNNQWAQSTPLRPDRTNLLPFPVNVLPPIIGDMAQAIATTTSTDVAMAGTSILSAVSYCFSGVYRMSAKRDHNDPLVLDTLTIAEPSFKKSPVMSLIKRPYIQFAHDWNENNKQDIFTSHAAQAGTLPAGSVQHGRSGDPAAMCQKHCPLSAADDRDLFGPAAWRTARTAVASCEFSNRLSHCRRKSGNCQQSNDHQSPENTERQTGDSDSRNAAAAVERHQSRTPRRTK